MFRFNYRHQGAHYLSLAEVWVVLNLQFFDSIRFV
jgi:hypothetical protein